MSNTNENNRPLELSPADQAAVEQVLAAVSPIPPRIDRDRLMFLAGAASVLASGGRGTDGSAVGPAEAIGVALQNTPTQAWDVAPVPPTSDLRPLTSGSAWHWPAATAALAATSLALAIALLARPIPAERIVYVPQPVELASTPTRDANLTSDLPPPTSGLRPPTPDPRRPTTVHQHNYLRTRDVALRFGLDALGTPTSGSGGDASAPTYRSLLETMSPAQPRSPGEASELPQM